ncbi:MAG: hypothetical protein Kow0079_10410 [Vicingaceae bacterium]
MKKILYLPLLLLVFSCTEETITDTDEKMVDSTGIKERATTTQKIFYTIPSPVETGMIFQKAGAEYRKELLNPIENISNYTVQNEQAINLGVYGADLSYVNIFDQTQEALFYLNGAKKLADQLGVLNAFDESSLERMEENINIRDSVMTIISDSYWKVDTYLKSVGQEHLSALVVAGGWIEGLYIGTQMNALTQDKPLSKKIADQKHSLNNLIALLNIYKNNEEVNRIKNKLLDLKTAYDKIVETEGEVEITTVDSIKTSIIDSSIELKFTDEIIMEITEKIKQIRNEII